MSKIVQFNTKARKKLLKGIDILNEAVASTLGPRGRNVSIGRPFSPLTVHDGVTVARNIELSDPIQNLGAQLVKQAAAKTNDKAGDGTTTATILAHALATEAIKLIEAGVNPMVIKSEYEQCLEIALAKLDELKQEIKTDEEIEQIATISAADAEIGKLVAAAIKQVGKDGVVTIEEGQGLTTDVEYKDGYEFDRGYLSPYFVTDQERVEAILSEPYILITDKQLNYNFDILPFLERFITYAKKRDLVIIAGQVSEEALATLVMNNAAHNLNVVAVQAPAWGGRRTDELEDIAIVTGGTAILEEAGRTLDSILEEELGHCEKFIADRDRSVIVSGSGDKAAVEKRLEELRAQVKVANTDFDGEIKKQRLAKLSGGVAIIKVGAATEIELGEKKERVIDAVNATQAGIADGIVAGGEITLRTIARAIGDDYMAFSWALNQPFRTLVENAGLEYSEMAVALADKDYPIGIDVTDGKAKDLIAAGIIDPVKVTKSALENAVSVANMIATTSTVIVDKPEK